MTWFTTKCSRTNRLRRTAVIMPIREAEFAICDLRFAIADIASEILTRWNLPGPSPCPLPALLHRKREWHGERDQGGIQGEGLGFFRTLRKFLDRIRMSVPIAD